MILALETSCDDTCAAVLSPVGALLSNIISSQGVHDQFGGVVPEVASRHHLQLVNVVIAEALRKADTELDAIERVAVTQGPGLVGALLIGLSTAKALAGARGVPLAAVDHLQGHVAASFLPGVDPNGNPTAPLEPPFLCLVASGGHTFLALAEDHSSFTVLGRTLDDAAGEAFDKGARQLGLPYPGGPHVERLAAEGDASAFTFPISGGLGGLDFSFSGLKTSLLYRIRDLGEEATAHCRADLAASYQHAIVEALARRVEQAVAQTGVEQVSIGGGVAANGVLRRRLEGAATRVHVPPRALCTDNAAMIGAAALHGPWLAPGEYEGLDAYPTGRRDL